MITIKNKTIRKYDKKTNDYTRVVNPFEKYKVIEIRQSESTKFRTIIVQGPKQTFYLSECQHPLKIYEPEKPVRELPLFFIQGGRIGLSNTKIQGASFFALDGDVLIPYASDGRGCVREILKDI